MEGREPTHPLTADTVTSLCHFHPALWASLSFRVACSLLSSHCFSRCFYLFFYPRKPQPSISTWKRQRKSIPTCWSQTSSSEEFSVSFRPANWSWNPRWICCRPRVRRCRNMSGDVGTLRLATLLPLACPLTSAAHGPCPLMAQLTGRGAMSAAFCRGWEVLGGCE